MSGTASSSIKVIASPHEPRLHLPFPPALTDSGSFGWLGLCTVRPQPSNCFQINMTHYIKHLSFGEDYPGIVNPLDHTNVTAPQGTILGGSPFAHQNCPAPTPCASFSTQRP